MPYMFVEELPEGAEEADVVPSSDYLTAVEERREALASVEAMGDELKARDNTLDSLRQKYADAVVNASQNVDNEADDDTMEAQTFDILWD